MKVYAKFQGLRYRLYRIGRSSHADQIGGEISPFMTRLMRQDPNLSDIHFSYPRDGNLHYTYRFKDDSSLRGYWDKVVHRPSGNEQPRLEAIAKYPMLQMLPNSRLPALKDYEQEAQFYAFPASATYWQPQAPFFTEEFASSSRPTAEDICIDADGLDMVQVLTFLLGNGAPFDFAAFVAHVGQEVLGHWVGDKHWPHIQVVVLGSAT